MSAPCFAQFTAEGLFEAGMRELEAGGLQLGRHDARAGQEQGSAHFAEEKTDNGGREGEDRGRRRTRPRVLVNSRLVTGLGDTAFTGPETSSASMR